MEEQISIAALLGQLDESKPNTRITRYEDMDPSEFDGTIGRSGVRIHNSLNILDTTKIAAYLDCPRRFFYNYVMGWTSESANIHLEFGSAWHEAMEHIMLNGTSAESINEAYQKFLVIFNKAFPNDSSSPGKNKANALKALIEYAQRWGKDFTHYTTLYTEVAGAVPLDEDGEKLLYVKMDTIRQNNKSGHVFSLEHKTTGRLSQGWKDKWNIVPQPVSYMWALRVLFPEFPVYGTVINGAVLRAKTNEFIRVPVKYDVNRVQLWLNTLTDAIDRIQNDFDRLAECSPDDKVLNAFYPNGPSCTKFSCAEPHICGYVFNPLRYVHEAPPGKVINYWDPRREEESAKTTTTKILTDGRGK